MANTKRRRHMPYWARGLCLILGLLGLVRLILNPVLTWGINRKLRQLPDMQGAIEQARFSFWPGRFVAEGVQFDLCIEDTAKHVRVKRPILRVRRLTSTWQYWALVRGIVQGSLRVESPQVTLWRIAEQQKAAPKAQKAAPQDTEAMMRWREPLLRLIPLRVDRVDVENASVRFVDTASTPPVDLTVKQGSLHLRNLTNRSQLKEAMYATATLDAKLPGAGQMRLDMKLDPIAVSPTFSLHTQVQHVDLVPLNALLQAYGNIDLNAGHFDVFAELAAHGGQFEGYVKPLLHDIRVRIWHDKEPSNGPLQLAWRATVGAVTGLLRNRETNSVGTKLPCEGKFDSPKIGIWAAVVDLLSNAFIRALLPQLDYSTSMAHLPK